MFADDAAFVYAWCLRRLDSQHGGWCKLREQGKKERWAYDERILGSGRFVEEILKRAESEPATVAAPGYEREERFHRLISSMSKNSGHSLEHQTV